MTTETISLFNQKGNKISEVPLDKKVFDGEVNIPLLHQVVRMYQANLRQGTHATKTRGEVSGGGKKPWRQKGTGRARVGSIRTPLWRHGGTVFGPHPREYSYTLPKQMKRSALRSGLNAKIRDGELILIDQFQIDKPKTKEIAILLETLKIRGKTLVVVAKMTDPVKLSCRNIERLSLKTGEQVNAYDLLRHPKIVIEQEAFKALSESVKGESSS